MPIATLFWGYGAGVALPLNIITTAAMYALLAADLPVAGFIVGYCIATPVTLLVAVGLWRAAGRLASPTERVLLRTVTLTSALLLALT